MSARTKRSSTAKSKVKPKAVPRPYAFQVYAPDATRELIRRAVEIRNLTQSTGLSDFIINAAIKEATQIVSEHALSAVHTKHVIPEEVA